MRHHQRITSALLKLNTKCWFLFSSNEFRSENSERYSQSHGFDKIQIGTNHG